MGEVKNGKLFDFKKMWRTLFDPGVGVTFLISLIFFLAFSCAIIYGFQPFTLNVLHITETQNALLFTLFGAMGLISQTFLVGHLFLKSLAQKSFSSSILLTAMTFLVMFLSHSIAVFVGAILVLALVNSLVQTLIPTILSQETDEKSPGSSWDSNASYQSIGMIFGPIMGGAMATISIPMTFLTASILVLGCFFLSFYAIRTTKEKESVF